MAMLIDTYGDRVRVRVGALIFDTSDDPREVLLVKHAGSSEGGSFWTPPGGGVEFGEALTEALHREVAEEIDAEIEIGDLLYTLDFVRPPLHAVSFYFRARLQGHDFTVGSDPELDSDQQLIKDVRFISIDRCDRYRIVPEGLSAHLRQDISSDNCRGTARYLGTHR
jgi:8-oxo-dGTP diphosphatase